jgi:hypothetical protein
MRGGQAAAHPPVQVEEVALSPAWVYTVIPLGPIRTVPKLGESAVSTMTPAGLEAPPPTWVGLAPLEVQPATTRTAVAKRVRTRVTRIEVNSEV